MSQIPSIRAVMTAFPHTVEADAPLRVARQQMLDREIHHLPVTREGKLVGLVSDRDLKRILDPALGMPPRNELFVEDAMVHDPYVVDPADALDDVLEEMAEGHIGSALVAEDGRLVGIFTSIDACRFFAEHLRTAAGALRPG